MRRQVKRPFLTFLAAGLIVSLAMASSAQTQTRSPKEQQAVVQPQTRIRAVAEAVVVDVVVRDSNGRPVEDLKVEEIEVLENGIQQEIQTFQIIKKSSLINRKDASPQVGRVDPLRHINLVSLVFERLGNEARQFSRQAALDLLDTQLGPNTLVAVFTIDRRLYVLQQFSNDVKRLREAIQQATSGAYAKFRTQSENIRQELEKAMVSQQAAEETMEELQKVAISPRSDPEEVMQMRAAMLEALTQSTLAEMTINVLLRMDAMQQEHQGYASLDSLRALVGEQRRLAGRKTLIFFSEGLQVPPNIVDRFRLLISEANRANVSIYSVDTRGLITSGLTQGARSLLQRAADVSRQQVQSTGAAVSRSQVLIGESAEESLRLNVQGTLDDLARSTGGFLIANTNDARPGMKLIHEDIHTYYELVYKPKTINYDGQFRRILVKVSRPDVTVQTRSGYFALPPHDDHPILPYELSLLTALSAGPHDFQHQSRMLRFEPRGDRIEHVLIMEVPLQDFTFQENKETNTYQTRFSLMALLKNGQGEVVERFSQDYPLAGPLEKAPSLKSGNVIFIRQLELAPGAYALETVALDHPSDKASTTRLEFQVPVRQAGVKLSSVSIIRRADQLTLQEQNTRNPLRYEQVKIVPNLGEPIKLTPETQLGLYCVVYPASEIAEKPQAAVQFLLNGRSVAQGSPALGAPDAEGRIPLVLTLSAAPFKAGDYQVRVVVQQGPSSAEERASFALIQ